MHEFATTQRNIVSGQPRAGSVDDLTFHGELVVDARGQGDPPLRRLALLGGLVEPLDGDLRCRVVIVHHQLSEVVVG
jgi:hypothetical protein